MMKEEIHVVNTEQTYKTMKRMQALKLALDVIDFRIDNINDAHSIASCLLCHAYDSVRGTLNCKDCPVHWKNNPHYACKTFNFDLDAVVDKLTEQKNLFWQELEVLKGQVK